MTLKWNFGEQIENIHVPKRMLVKVLQIRVQNQQRREFSLKISVLQYS